ncbi:reverse transcriptase domain-containing protein [Psychroserpens jangbogonensis]|uniref:reverse transcriptase domain-containing protein n=1 Tax=Psychroserpens jangbogonensis TaxID=1484460 RepID=UPI00068D10BD|nr:reverse transcriptase domain-containing protein [Psychroserpens jangbogonensis]
MELEQTHIDEIRTAFQNMQTKEDLLSLMNSVKPLLYGEKSVPFELKQLTYYANPNLGKTRYTEFKIKKKSGGNRSIHAPVNGLKSIQKTLALILQCVFVPHKAAMGFVKEKSIVDNAKIHIGNRYVYNIDLKDFFQSVDQARVWKCMQLKPFNLNDLNLHKNNFVLPDDLKISNLHTVEKSKNGLFIGYNLIGERFISREFILENNAYVIGKKVFDKNYYSVKHMFLNQENAVTEYVNMIRNGGGRQKINNIISNICCTKMIVERKDENGIWHKVSRNVLPQGAPTSPILTNVVCQRLDYLLTAVAKRFGLKYSRYADDITFSSLHNVFQKESDFLTELERVILDQGFTIKASKTRLQVDGMRKEVTGLVVNDNVNVKKRYIKQLRMWLNYWETYGYYKAEVIFKKDYFKDKGHVKTGQPSLRNVIDGKLNYLQMVKGAKDSTYLKLKNRFEKLNENTEVNMILQIWEDQGIENAIAAFDVSKKNSKKRIQINTDFDQSDYKVIINL